MPEEAVTPIAIRPFTSADAPALVEAVRESIVELEPWMPWCHPGYSLADAAAFIRSAMEGFAKRTAFEVAITSGRTIVGVSGLNQLDNTNLRANVGYWVRSTATRRGVATSAVGLVRRWAFASTDLVRLEILVATANVASQRVAEKAGAVREGVLRRRLLIHGGSHDAVMFSLTRP
jgi:RimJ/RimL family protein N-acetyltransferase